MKTHISLILALSALSASALDLHPHYIDADADGVSIRRPYFSDGSKKYSLRLNNETELQPYEDGAIFRFIKLKDAAMRLRPSPFSVDTKFDPENLTRYLETARQLLPQLAEGVALYQETPNPMPINAWTSHRFVFKYKTQVGEVRESITFLNITPTAQVIVQVYAMDKEFADADSRAWDIIRRWYELDSSTASRGN